MKPDTAGRWYPRKCTEAERRHGALCGLVKAGMDVAVVHAHQICIVDPSASIFQRSGIE